MEARPWTKSEFFAWNDGRRIVDLGELSKQLHCKQCSSLLDLQRTERETRYGLASVLYILCNCGVMNYVHTGKMQQDGGDKSSPNLMYEVNIKASINLLLYGAGASRILSFLALLDIPVPPPDDTSLIVPVTDDAEVQNTSSSLPATSAVTTLTTSISTQPSTAVPEASSFHKDPSSSAVTPSQSVSSVPNPVPSQEEDSSGVLLEANNESEDVNDNHDKGQSEEEEEQNDIEDIDDVEEDDDDEYVPPTKLKLKLKPKPPPAPSPKRKKKGVLRSSRSARAKQVEKVPEPPKPPKKVSKLKIKVKTVKKDTSVEVVEEQSKDQSKDSSNKDFDNPMDWSSTESENESVKGKDTDASWHEEEEEQKEEEEAVEEEKPKRKRGRPRGSTDRAKRAKKSGPKPKKEPAARKTQVEGEAKDHPKCTTCAKDFNSIKGYNVHMKRVHNQDMKGKVDPVLYVCSICKQPFAREYSVLSHIEKKHWTPSLDPKENFETRQLAEVMKRVPREAAVQRGQSRERYGTTQECLSCGKTSMDQDKASKHICVDSAGQLTCVTLCPDGLKLAHMQRCLLYSSKLGHLCDHCGSIFSNKTSFDMHLINIHGQSTKRSEKYKCSVCNHSFGDRSALRHHENTHVTEKSNSHICDICGKAFKTQDTLSVHRRRVHVQSKRYKCEYCSKTYFGKSMWKTHMQQHLGESPYHCTTCNQGFSSNYCLTVHMRIHTGEKPYKCQHCNAAFAQKNSIDVHMKKHQKLGDMELSQKTSIQHFGHSLKGTDTHPPSVSLLQDKMDKSKHDTVFSTTVSNLGNRSMSHFKDVLNPTDSNPQNSVSYCGEGDIEMDSVSHQSSEQCKENTENVDFPGHSSVFPETASFPPVPSYLGSDYGPSVSSHFQSR